MQGFKGSAGGTNGAELWKAGRWDRRMSLRKTVPIDAVSGIDE